MSAWGNAASVYVELMPDVVVIEEREAGENRSVCFAAGGRIAGIRFEHVADGVRVDGLPADPTLLVRELQAVGITPVDVSVVSGSARIVEDGAGYVMRERSTVTHGSDCACPRCRAENRRGLVPERITASQPWDHEGALPDDGQQLGYAMTSQMVRYCEEGLSKRRAEERLVQLSRMNERCAAAYLARTNGVHPAGIAAQMQCSLRTVQRLLAEGRDCMERMDDSIEESYDRKLERMLVEDPEAADVYLFLGNGWKQQAVADLFGLSLDQVKRRTARAVAVLGPWRGDAARRHRRRVSLSQSRT